MTRDQLVSFLRMQVWKLHNTAFQNVKFCSRPNPLVQREGVTHGCNQKEFDVEQDCQDRFGQDWVTVRKHMLQAVQNVEILPGMKMPPDRVAKGLMLGGGTSNWMTNAFLAVLYMYFYSPSRYTAFELGLDQKGGLQGNQYQTGNADMLFLEDWIKNLLSLPEKDLQETKKMNTMFTKLSWDMLKVAIYLCPEDVMEVLESHKDVLPLRSGE